MDQFTSIKDFTRPRLPRLGKIHLGVKKKNAKGFEYPTETDYFVCPEEIQKVYGEKPKELEVVFPVGNPAIVAPYSYRKYGAAGLSCKGDGETYSRVIADGMEQGECPGPAECAFAKDGKGNIVCKAVMNLYVMLPKVSLGGVYQIDTGSWHTITNILSQFQWAQAAYGKFAMVPFFLRRVPKETQHEAGKKSIHYPLELHLPDNETIKKLVTNTTSVMRFLRGVDERLALPAPSPREIEAEQFPKSVVEEVVKGGGTAIEPPEGEDPTRGMPPVGKPVSEKIGRKKPPEKPRASLLPDDAPPETPQENDDGPPDDLEQDPGGDVLG